MPDTVDEFMGTGLPATCRDPVRCGRWRDALLEYVRARDWVTFAELQSGFERFFPTRGDLAITPGAFPNIVLWAGMSEEFLAAVKELLASGAVVFQSASLLAYLVDGGALSLPLLKRMPKAGGPKTPRWLPVCLRTKEQAEAPKGSRNKREVQS